MLRRSAVRHPSVLKREVQLVRFDAKSHELTRSGNPGTGIIRFEITLESG